MSYALKEWSATVSALRAGDQVLTLRKGGIREPSKHFEIDQRQFFLYPTFDHQRTDLIDAHFRHHLEAGLADARWSSGQPGSSFDEERTPLPDQIALTSWAEIETDFAVADEAIVNELAPFHIWTTDYASKKLNWKPRHPLHVLVLRVHRLDEPIWIDVSSDQLGCKSWLELDHDIAEHRSTPALDSEAFSAQLEAITSIGGIRSTV